MKALTILNTKSFPNQVPPETPFFAQLDGRRFQVIPEKVHADKPFDEKFAKCLIASAKALSDGNLTPSLVYITNDEMNVLLLHESPFRQRIKKTRFSPELPPAPFH